MKRSDIITILFIALMSVVVAYFAANAIIGKPSSKSVTVRTATPISADIQQPDPAVFNKEAINPTVEVEIGDSNTDGDK